MAQAIASLWQGITYRGREGHWAWMLHRVSGLGIILFLFLHVLDMFLIGVSEDLFNAFLVFYHAALFKPLLIALLFGVFYHAFNGLRIILVDFWPDRFSNLRAQRIMFRIVVLATLLVFIPAALITVAPVFGIHMPWWPTA
jgi:succinate dehydrogenase / fumarate reductase cytochrome b subunit